MKAQTTVYVPASLHRRAKVKAVRDGTNLSTVTERLWSMWLKGEIKLEEPTPVS
jgi:hypothetical protein